MAKILLYDLETSPNLGYVWGKYETNVLSFTAESEILSMAWKWLGDKDVQVATRADFRDKTDLSLCKQLWKLLDEADVVIGHNLVNFDNKKANARFAAHKMPPPSPFISIDTLKIARKHFKFNSNSLNDLCEHLKIGKKEATGGFELWLQCIAGNKEAFKKMATYNKQDVVLLEQIYNRFKPWISNHPNIALMNKKPKHCPRGCKGMKIKSHGLTYTKTQTYRRFRCYECWGVFREQGSMENEPVGVVPV